MLATAFTLQTSNPRTKIEYPKARRLISDPVPLCSNSEVLYLPFEENDSLMVDTCIYQP